MAGYVEVFILVAIAIGGSGLVFSAALSLLGSGTGPGVGIVSAAIRQGPSGAVETVTVADLGAEPLGAFVVSTSGAPAAATYCYSVEDAGGGALISTTCPAASVDPASVDVAASVPAGGAVDVQFVITGASFAQGSGHQITVTAAGGAQASAFAQVAPA